MQPYPITRMERENGEMREVGRESKSGSKKEI